MARIQRQDREAQATIEGYVSELTRQTLRRLPAEEARRAAAEVEGHLAERVAALEAAGAGRREAETEALAGFGPARRLARDLADSAYADRWTPAWRALGGALTGALLALPVAAQILRAGNPATAVAEWGHAEATAALGVAVRGGIPLTPVLLAGAALCAFLARRASPARMIAVGSAAATAAFAVSGLTTVWSARGPLDTFAATQAAADYPDRVAHLWREQLVAGYGVAYYAHDGDAAAPDPRMPRELRRGKAFIVPLSGAEASPLSVFRPLTAADRARIAADGGGWWGMLYGPHGLHSLPYRTVTDYGEAKRLWRAHGRAALSEARSRYAAALRDRAVYQDASVRSGLAFDAAAGATAVPWCIEVTALLLGADAAGAALGRRAWRLRRGDRRTRPSQA
jgi:hypothetical protein